MSFSADVSFEDSDCEPHEGLSQFRVVSWNLLRLVGAGVEDVAALVREHRPDLMLMQEATADIAALPKLVGGQMYREPMDRRVYGLAAWSPRPFPQPEPLPLPVSRMPGRVPPRLAQIVRFGGVTFANVHLSHGQFLNRLQLLRIVRSIDGPLAIIGDYNAVGPIRMRGFRDIGPRMATHTTNIIPFRLDRCMARGIHCRVSQVAERGPSDHCPIILDLAVASETEGEAHARGLLRLRQQGAAAARIGTWLRTLSQSPEPGRMILREMRGLARRDDDLSPP